MSSTWLDRARLFIAEEMKDAPADMPLQDRKKALRAVAWRFHGYTSWGRKVWSRATREYLAPFAYKSDREVPKKHLSPMERMMRATAEHEAKLRMK